MAFDPTGITEALGIAQGIYGAFKAGATEKKINALLEKRTAYKTPDEIFKILNATEQKSQGDTITRDFELGQLDQGFANTLGTVQLLGGDPNTAASLFDRKMQGILQVGQQFHASNMEAFGKYMGALNLVSENKAAEWQSQQDILKDKLQAASGAKGDAFKNISGGINTLLSGLAANAEMGLYGNPKGKSNNTLGYNYSGGGNTSGGGAGGGQG